MEQKEQWANEVLASLKGIESARPSDALFAKISSQLSEKVQVKIIPMRKLYWVAIAACAVVILNIFAFSSEISENTNEVKSNLYQAQVLSDFNLYN